MPMKILSVRLDDNEEAQLRSVCERMGLSQTEVVKKGIATLAEQSTMTPGKLAEAMGLVGVFESGIGDLGRNHSSHLKSVLRRKHRASRAR
jgi:hypothetical protein